MAWGSDDQRTFAAIAERHGAWVRERLRERLVNRSNRDDFTIDALWPVICDWFATAIPATEPHHDSFAIEVAFQTGDDVDPFPLDPPDGLDPTAQWFNVDFCRRPSSGTDEGLYQSVTVLELWFAPATPLFTMLDDPAWDADNLLGFDCLGQAGSSAGAWCTQPSATRIVDAFSGLEPAAVLLLGGPEDLRLR